MSIIKSFFSKGHTRSINLKKNIIAMLVLKGISIGVSIVLVPLTIDFVNPMRYGIWLTLSSIVTWFTFFDIGFGNSLRNRFAESKAINDNEKARAYISTVYAALTIIFSIVWIVFFITNYFVSWASLLNAPVSMNVELTKLAIIVFSFFCLQIILNTINTLLIADQKPAKAAFLSMLGQVLSLIIIYVLTRISSSSLVLLGTAIGFSPVFVMIISSVWYYRNDYKIFSPSIKHVNFKLTKDILNLGFKFFSIQIASLIIFQTNNIIIAQINGPDDVTIYNLAYKYFYILTMTFMIVLTPFWSAYTEAQAINDYKWMNGVLKKLKLLWIILAFCAIVMLFVSPIMFHLWIGNKVLVPFNVLISVFFYTLIFNWNAIFSQIIAGLGKIKLSFYLVIIVGLVDIPLCVYLGKIWGIIGVVWANTIVLIFGAIIGPIQLSMLLNQKAKGIWNK